MRASSLNVEMIDLTLESLAQALGHDPGVAETVPPHHPASDDLGRATTPSRSATKMVSSTPENGLARKSQLGPIRSMASIASSG